MVIIPDGCYFGKRLLLSQDYFAMRGSFVQKLATERRNGSVFVYTYLQLQHVFASSQYFPCLLPKAEMLLIVLFRTTSILLV